MWSDSTWSKGWRLTEQQDAHEFAMFLIDQMVDPQMPKYDQSRLEHVTSD